MNCSACGQGNPERAKFCLACGSPFSLRCARCAAELPPAAKFCLECGLAAGAVATAARSPRAYTPKHLADKILASRAALEGERKQVTVLFADVRGSMELAEQLGAEQWHAILDRFFAILADGVHRFEGTVNQYTGDGIMALFGAPLAHEDHAQRACYAALALQTELGRFATELKRAHGVSFSTRIGLHSGDVVVGKIGDDLRMDYTAQGQTVGLAQRMEALASPDTAYLSAETAQRVAGYFALEDLGEFRVKGVAQPVRVYRLVGPGALRTRFDASRARGLSRFVGRASELAALEAALERAVEGQGGVVGIVAEAGTGKSRLCFELAEHARARGVGVRQTQAYAHTQNIPLVPVLELYRQIFGIAAGDAPQAAREKIAGRIVLLDEEAREALPLLFDFLGVADPERPAPALEPELRERRLLDLLRRLTTARGKREPALVVFEDLHWADPASVRFAAALCDAAEASRTFVVLNYRPEFRAPWAGRSWAQQIALRPLDADATAELLASWLGADVSLGPVITAIQARAAGNPFFVEELVLSLVESGALAGERGRYRLARAAETLALPATVQALLAARIDRLGEREKDLLATAAVIGQVFTERLLSRASGAAPEDLRAALAVLVERELIVERALYPEAEYAFRHPLVVEVAYQAQLAIRRARIHGAVARALAEAAGERADAQAPLVAQHFDAAGEAEPALRWHARAARLLVSQNAASAVAHARRVLALEASLSPTPEIASASQEARLLLALALGRSGEAREGERTAVMREALEAAERSGDSGTLAILLANEGFVRWARGENDWEEPLARAGELALQAGSRVHEALVAHLHSVCFFALGRLGRGGTFATRALEHLEGEPLELPLLAGYDERLRCMHLSANLDHLAGRIAQAHTTRERALALGNRGDAMGYAFVLSGRVSSGILIGGGPAWLADARAAFELMEQAGTSASSQMLAEQLLALGYAQEARDLALAAREPARAAHHQFNLRAISRIAAVACAAVGDFARARVAADEAVALSQQLGANPSTALLARARVGLAMRDESAADAIAADLALALEAARSEGAGLWEAETLEACAELAALRGDPAARERALREALAIWERGGAMACVERVRKALADA